MKLSYLGAFLALVTLGASTASAATLAIVGGNDTTVAISSNTPDFNLEQTVAEVNDAGQTSLDLLTFNAGNIAGAGLYLDGLARVTFTFLGSEAGARNRFVELIGGERLVNASRFVGDTVSAVFDTGFLDFKFASSTDALIRNGVRARDGGQLGLQLTSDTSAYLFFGDGTGDSDFDDMVIRADVSAVPLPASSLLLLAGVGGLGLMSRKQKTAQAV